MNDEHGMPIVVDSSDVYKIRDEVHLRSDILRFANLFAGEEKYMYVEERYEL